MLSLILKALPLCHWFYEGCTRSPFFSLDYGVQSLSALIRNVDGEMFTFVAETRY